MEEERVAVRGWMVALFSCVVACTQLKADELAPDAPSPDGSASLGDASDMGDGDVDAATGTPDAASVGGDGSTGPDDGTAGDAGDGGASSAVGETCSNDAECLSGNCDGLQCRVACAPDCALNEACVDGDDCETGACGDGACVPSCAPDCGVGDDCTESADCADGSACKEGLCRPECSGSCKPGDACAADDDCPDGSCHEADRVCLDEGCTSGSLSSVVGLEPLQYCERIVGNLELADGFTAVTSTDLPYLREVTGDVTSAFNNALVEVTFSALEKVGGTFNFGLIGGVYTLSAPRLQSIGDPAAPDGIGLQIIQGSHTSVSLPTLEMVYGFVSLEGGSVQSIDLRALRTVTSWMRIVASPSLESVDLRALESVGGNFTLAETTVSSVLLNSLASVDGTLEFNALPCLWYSAIDQLDTATIPGDRVFEEIGCDTISNHACTSMPGVCN